MFTKHQCGEHEDIGVIVLPRVARQASLEAGLLNKGVTVPVFFHGNLRQQESFDIALLHNQSMFAHLDLFDF